MTNQSTIDKLIEMHLTSMSDAFRNQLNDTKMKEIPFEDRFGMLVDIEYSSRKNNRLKRMIKNAELDHVDASVMDIDYTSGRRLNKALIQRMATCEYITEHRNIFITGATGSGKTYMSCAFGMEACKRYYTTKYIRLPDLLLDLEMARNEGTYRKVLKKYTDPLLLIIDEWLSGNDGPLADAILDRIMHDAYKINIESVDPAKDISMREVYGSDKTISE